MFKTGARLIRLARYFVLQFAEIYLTENLFRQILRRIELLEWHPTVEVSLRRVVTGGKRLEDAGSAARAPRARPPGHLLRMCSMGGEALWHYSPV